MYYYTVNVLCFYILVLHFTDFFQNKNISVLINDGMIFFVRRIFVCNCGII